MKTFIPHRGSITLLLLHLTALGAAVWLVRDPRTTAVRILPPPTPTPAPSATPVRLHVYVSGAVATPDVVVLPEGARARDAIAAAGGFAPPAARAAVNLAAPLADGQQLHVPAEGEAVGAVAGAGGIPGVGEASAGSVGSATGGGAPNPVLAAGSGQPININLASAADLETLPGIGPALASRIVAYRAANGPFKSADDLLAVPGIGEKTLARFADRVVAR